MTRNTSKFCVTSLCISYHCCDKKKWSRLRLRVEGFILIHSLSNFNPQALSTSGLGAQWDRAFQADNIRGKTLLSHGRQKQSPRHTDNSLGSTQDSWALRHSLPSHNTITSCKPPCSTQEPIGSISHSSCNPFYLFKGIMSKHSHISTLSSLYYRQTSRKTAWFRLFDCLILFAYFMIVALNFY